MGSVLFYNLNMKITRYSLIYLASYLTFGGLGFFFFPTSFSKLLLSNAVYTEDAIRLAGIFSTLLGVIVIQIIRHKVDILYPTSVLARILGLFGLMYVYFNTKNPMFFTLSLIVTFGLIVTIFSLIKDKQKFVL